MKTALSGVVLTLSLFGVSGCSDDEEQPLGKVIVGGVDFQSHCGDRKFDESPTGGSCRSEVDLDAACKREFPEESDPKLVLQDLGNPKSGLCISGRKQLGGISDMLGYCAETHAKGDRAKAAAELRGDTWQCREKLDVKALCIGRYNDSRLEAEEVGGLWQCYRYSRTA
ncbi:hypothetical protein [Actinoplanes flavus]|uniref:Lipoprotein n=1 Tax=Actinoplanes flavus TaxID=2820290 RepID=A0ABS3UJJ6_9ACTN|nr:hypothetical protein [Actinoplanes flavus]MBO3738952.1 hypothetical protein [Actinoplanes flavus]